MLLLGVREEFLQIHFGLLGHKKMHTSPAMQKVTATSSFSLTGSFQKVTRAINDSTRLFLDVSIFASQDMSL